MEDNKQPLVSVPVITYNSAKYVIETLESIKAQTYQDIELIVSDDCSTDNTIELCQQWVEENKERFIRTRIITVNKNTGVSANLNRAESVCRGEWVKSVAGDDLLMPDCIANYIDYIHSNEKAKFVFARYLVFGENKDWCDSINLNIDYSFFTLSLHEKLNQLIFHGNKICATTYFYNREYAQKIQITNDERIPLIEDYPRWIVLLEKGEDLFFLDKVTILYRIGRGLSTSNRMSIKYYESVRLLHYYYLYPRWLSRNQEKAIEKSVADDLEIYKSLCELELRGADGIQKERDELRLKNNDLERQLFLRKNSSSYKLGYFLLHPIKSIINLIKLNK